MSDPKLADIKVSLIGEADLIVAQRQAVAEDKIAIEQMKADIENMQSDVDNDQSDVSTRHTDIVVKHGEVEADRSEVSSNRQDVEDRQTDIINRQNDVTSRQSDITVKHNTVLNTAETVAEDKAQVASDKVDVGNTVTAFNTTVANALQALTDEGDQQNTRVIATGESQEQRVIDAGDTERDDVVQEGINQRNLVSTESTNQQTLISAKGTEQSDHVKAEGDGQVLRVQTEGNNQISRVIAEGDTQTARSTSEADRSLNEANLAQTHRNYVEDFAGRFGDVDQAITDATDQADRANTEADRSKNEAARSSEKNALAESHADRADAAANRADQIAELETVRDTLIASAVPAPDFHLPLVSDLYIREGFGPADQLDISTEQDGSQLVNLPTRSASFSRDSIKWYTNKSGVLTKAEINEPAFEQEGILLEGSSTNIVPRSNHFSSHWVKYPDSSTTVITDNAETGPDGIEGSASQLDFVGNSAWLLTYNLGSADQTKAHTASIWMKGSVGGEQIKIDFKNQASVGQQGDTFNLTTRWQRYQVSTVDPGDGNHNIQGFQIRKNDGVPGTIFIYGAQLEPLPFATSYIPTTGSTATRSPDYLRFQRACNLVESSRVPMSWSIDFNRLGDVPGKTGYMIFCYGRNIDAGTNGWALVVWPSSDAYGGMRVRQGIDLVMPIITDTKMHRLITTGEEQKLLVYLDGQLTGSGNQANLTRLYISEEVSLGHGGDQCMYGHIRDFKIWHRALTPEQISVLG